jgi:hypothetical protein
MRMMALTPRAVLTTCSSASLMPVPSVPLR